MRHVLIRNAAMEPKHDIALEQSLSVTEIVELDDTAAVSAAETGIALPLGIIQAASKQIFDSLPFAICMTDAEGYLTYFNSAAIEFSGRLPTIGRDRWCVCWRLFSWNGDDIAHEECPMALTIRSGTPIRGIRTVAERPNGIRAAFMPYPTPLRDPNGKLIGAFNLMVPVNTLPRWCTERR
jgi:PAS domain-containing protein